MRPFIQFILKMLMIFGLVFFRKKNLYFIFRKPLYADEYKSRVKEGEYRQLATIILNRINGTSDEN